MFDSYQFVVIGWHALATRLRRLQCAALQEDAELAIEEEWAMALHSKDFFWKAATVNELLLQ